MSIAVGQLAPRFSLPDTDGAPHSPGGAPATVVVFTCNHCPYALAWHERLLEVADDYADRGVRMLQICSNDAERYPQDSPEAMRERVREEGGWPTPYLHDATQEVARAYGALTTPDVFVLDAERRLRYRGAPDGDHMHPAQNAAWLRAALDELLAGDPVSQPETKPVGCSIKWRP
ncbi:MAG TPA: thioredoxin family protein [Solirubrobacteraceae bacterium]|jgi:peroxiredoxin|nr:thioredoxin family protein [Solirubrobacteraceae bacterium]